MNSRRHPSASDRVPNDHDLTSDSRVPRDRTGAGLRRRSALNRVWAVRQFVGGVPFVVTEPGRAARELVAAAVGRAGGEHVHLVNAYSVALADQFPALAADAFCSDGWNLPDGRPVSWLSRMRRDSPALEQVRGPQFFLDVCDAGRAVGLRHYLLGGSERVRVKLQAELERRFPGIDIVGGDSPAYRAATEEELEQRDQAFLDSGAHVVWVGLGTPKQDIEVARIARSVPVVAVAIGAAFDYTAGTLREAPAWVGRLGLEWLFRLLAEPRRLWRRYLFGNTRFLVAAVRRGRGSL